MFFKKVIAICLLISGSFSFASNRYESLLNHIREEKFYIEQARDLVGSLQDLFEICQPQEEMRSEFNEIKLNLTNYAQRALPLLDEALNNSCDARKICEALAVSSTVSNGAPYFLRKIRELAERLE